MSDWQVVRLALWDKGDAPDKPVTIEETNEHTQNMNTFFEGKRGTGKRRAPRVVKEDKRVATLHQIRCLDNVLRVMSQDRRLHRYKLTTRRMEMLCELLTSGKLTVRHMQEEFPFISLYMDRASTNWTMSQYLQHHEKLLLINHNDNPCHGLSNACKAGFRASGHEALMRSCLPLANWNAGPWQSCRWLAFTHQSAQSLYRKLTSKDLLLRRLFPGIRMDRGLPSCSDEEIEKFLVEERKKMALPRMTKGEVLRWSTWFGFYKSMKFVVLYFWHSWRSFERASVATGLRLKRAADRLKPNTFRRHDTRMYVWHRPCRRSS
jgi:hypothetical protein